MLEHQKPVYQFQNLSLHKSLYLKTFGAQSKTVDLYGVCSSRLCISRNYCIFHKNRFDKILKQQGFLFYWTIDRKTELNKGLSK